MQCNTPSGISCSFGSDCSPSVHLLSLSPPHHWMELWRCVSFNLAKHNLLSNHFCSLYYEFVSFSTIGFGDLIPKDEATIGGGWDIRAFQKLSMYICATRDPSIHAFNILVTMQLKQQTNKCNNPTNSECNFSNEMSPCMKFAML